MNNPFVRGAYSAFPKTAWVSLAFAPLFLAALIKFMLDGVFQPIPYLLGAITASAAWPIVTWLWSGRFELDDKGLSGKRKMGGEFFIPRDQIARVERFGSEKNDSLGVQIRLVDGRQQLLKRIKPRAAIDQLIQQTRQSPVKKRLQ
jgi:hypothetical protein